MAINSKTLVERFFSHWNEGAFDDIGKLYHEDFTFTMPGSERDLNLAEYREWMQVMRSAYPDLKVIPRDIVAEGDKVAFQWLFKGTNDGALRHSPATGAPVTLTGLTLLHLRGDKVSQAFWHYDVVTVYKQLGRVPSIFATAT